MSLYLKKIYLVSFLFMILFFQPALSASNQLLSQKWSWEGMFGKYDKAQLQRGFQVFQEVCSSCHGIRQISYRHLTKIGYTPEQALAFAKSRDYEDGPDDTGEMFVRPGIISDYLVSPYANDKAAAASNGGVAPPDLSLMAKARANGPDYIYSLLLGYEAPPPEIILSETQHYNRYYSAGNGVIAMPKQIDDEVVEYKDGTSNTKHQIAQDITAFLNWTAEPELEERKSLGIKVLLYLFIMTVLFYAWKKRIWKNAH